MAKNFEMDPKEGEVDYEGEEDEGKGACEEVLPELILEKGWAGC